MSVCGRSPAAQRAPSAVSFSFGAPQSPPLPLPGGAVLCLMSPILPDSCHKLIHTEVLLSLSDFGFQGGKWLPSEVFVSPFPLRTA